MNGLCLYYQMSNSIIKHLFFDYKKGTGLTPMEKAL